MAIRALLWDFGDTLVDERWMRAPMVGVPEWQDTYLRVLRQDGFADRWNLGEISALDVAAVLGNELGISAVRVHSHMAHCSSNVAFFPRVLKFSSKCALPQAVVTINPDIFTAVVVPVFQLDRKFSPIVTSWESKTLDKAELCDLARGRIEGSLRREECLLVDNKLENVTAWKDRGGASFHFQSEHDVASIADALRH